MQLLNSTLSWAVEVPFGSEVAVGMVDWIITMLDATLPIVTDLVRDAARPLTGASTDYDLLLDFIGDARWPVEFCRDIKRG
jgi:hypothetical protein